MPDVVIAETADFDVGSIVAGLRQSRDVLHNVRYRGPVRPPPSRDAIVETLGQLTMALFPAHYGKLGNGNGSVTPDMIDDFVRVALDGRCGSSSSKSGAGSRSALAPMQPTTLSVTLPATSPSNSPDCRSSAAARQRPPGRL